MPFQPDFSGFSRHKTLLSALHNCKRKKYFGNATFTTYVALHIE